MTHQEVEERLDAVAERCTRCRHYDHCGACRHTDCFGTAAFRDYSSHERNVFALCKVAVNRDANPSYVHFKPGAALAQPCPLYERAQQ